MILAIKARPLLYSTFTVYSLPVSTRTMISLGVVDLQSGTDSSILVLTGCLTLACSCCEVRGLLTRLLILSY